MAYATLMHFMTQFSRRNLSSLGGAPFVWHVRFGIYFGCVGFGKLFWLCMGFGKLFWLYSNGVVNFFQVWMYEYFGVGLQIQGEVACIFPRFLRWLSKHRLSTPSRRSLEIWCLVIDNLTADDVSSSSSFFVKSLALGYGSISSHSRFLYDFLDGFKSLGWM